MRVWVLYDDGDYYGPSLLGIFSSKEKAEAAAAATPKLFKHLIEERDVDQYAPRVL